MKLKMFLGIMVMAVLIGCDKKQEVETSNMCNLEVASVIQCSSPKESKKFEIDKRKIIKKGEISIEVENLNNDKKSIEKTIKVFNGYCDNEQFTEGEGNSKYVYVIRIPSDNFDLFVSKIENGHNKILYKNISVEDVTERYFNSEMRLKSMREYLLRYYELLKKAVNVKDIIGIQEKVQEIEMDIEILEGELKFLDDQISYSTLELSLILRKEYIETLFFNESITSRAGRAIKSGAIGCIEFAIYMLRIWPVWIIFGILIFISLRLRRKHIRKINKP